MCAIQDFNANNKTMDGTDLPTGFWQPTVQFNDNEP